MEKSPEIKVKEINPKYYAQMCPVCHGFGTLKHGSRICHGCEGKGYIFVPVEIERQNYGERK